MTQQTYGYARPPAERAAVLGVRIEALADSLNVEVPSTNGHPYKAARERQAQHTHVRQQITELRAQRIAALREAWANWHARRLHLHRQIRTYERFARESREQLKELYAHKPPPLPLGRGEPANGGGVDTESETNLVKETA
jgi:hypothetical protein